jgi:hypothetical protein
MEPYQEDLAIIAKLRQDMADNADVMRVCVIAECANGGGNGADTEADS